jgi:hypothetical protein
MNFRELLSELNPLQYIPVVGTLYRAVTGDTVPERARLAGSLVVSGLAEGPVGVATNVAMLAVEKATGIDPEKIGTSLLARLGIGHAAVTTQIAARPAIPAASGAAPAPASWSPAQLEHYQPDWNRAYRDGGCRFSSQTEAALEHYQPDWNRAYRAGGLRADENARSNKELERPDGGCRFSSQTEAALAAYGMTRTQEESSDVLNDLELTRIKTFT